MRSLSDPNDARLIFDRHRQLRLRHRSRKLDSDRRNIPPVNQIKGYVASRDQSDVSRLTNADTTSQGHRSVQAQIG
jgi:hypothetical protein